MPYAHRAYDLVAQRSYYSGSVEPGFVHVRRHLRTYFAAQGILFHSNRPICHEAYVTANTIQTNPTGTNWVALGGKIGSGLSIVDTSALYGTGCDFPGGQATYQSLGVTAPGSSGVPGQRGGWTLMISFTTLPVFSGSPCALGSGWAGGGKNQNNVGTIQQGNTAHVNCGFAIDLVAITNLSGTYAPSVVGADPNSAHLVIPANTSPNTVGQTPRFSQIWCATDAGSHQTVPTIPGTVATFTATTPITASLMNNTVRQSLNLLNYPPALEVTALVSHTVPSSTVTKVQFGATQKMDNYSKWDSVNHRYIVPLTGVYFCHSIADFGIGTTSGIVSGGITVNASNFWGGAYPPSMTNGKMQTTAEITRVLDLNAGDTVSTFAWSTQAGGTNLSNVYASRMVMVWMAPLTNGSLTYTPPDVTGDLFAAGNAPGTGAGQMVPLFNAKIANDINFLVQRPYLTTFQSVAQTGLANTTWATVNMDQVKGLVHSSQGDNYGGWDAVNHRYSAKVAGWYLVTSEVGMNPAVGTAGTLVAGIKCPVSGGFTAPSQFQGPPDWYQEMIPSINTGVGPSAATACGLYYLLPNETVEPQIQWVNASGTFSTSVSAFNSTFSCIWMSN